MNILAHFCLRTLCIAWIFCSAVAATGERFQIVHEGFKDFSRGQFENAGQNIYVSRDGRIQLIQRWDLNNDGFYDLVLANSHNEMAGSVDALGYLQTERGFRSVISPVYSSLALYDLWLQEEKSRSSTIRFPVDRPTDVMFYDIDGDGYTDLLFASAGPGETPFGQSPIYWGSPRGFQRQRRLELPTVGASAVAVADLNSDGYVEIIYANRGSRHPKFDEGSYIYWGTPDRYHPRNRTTVPSSPAVSCDVGDLDGDGHPELVFATAAPDNGLLQVYAGTPAGPKLRSVAQTSLAEPQSIQIDQRNDLGRVILVVLQEMIELYRFRDGQLVRSQTIERGGKRAALADLDGDGKTDIVVAGGDRSAILWGEHHWSVEHATTLPTIDAHDVDVADLDRNGHSDIIFANREQKISGSLDVPSFIYWGKPWGYGVENRTDLQTFGAAAVQAEDLNLDGKPDLIFGNSGSGTALGKEIYVYWGRAHRGYSPAAMSSYPGVFALATAIADLDDDGHAELLVANVARHYSGTPVPSYLYRGTPEGPAVQSRQELPTNEPGCWSVADLNRDGFLDAVAMDFDAVAILWGHQKGTDVKLERIEDVAKAAQNCRLVDFNHDGWLDIFIADTLGERSRILLGSPQGYGPDRVMWMDQGEMGNLEFADLNNDSRLDLILCRSYNRSGDRNDSWVRIYYGADQGFPASPDHEFRTAGAYDLAVSDLNGDRHLDVAVSQYSSRDRRNLPLFIFWNDGNGSFSNDRRTSLPAEAAAGLLAGDFDEDGLNDLLVCNHRETYTQNNHSTDSFIYWGTSDGFKMEERSFLPTHGPHSLQNVDIGNLLTRKHEESYVSPAIQIPDSAGQLNLTAKVEQPLGSQVKFTVRWSAYRNGLEQTSWREVEPGHTLQRQSTDSWLQYRATLIAGRGYASPFLTRVCVQEDAE